MDRLAAIEAFISVVEAGSFSAGARRLELTQPAVSKAVMQLEQHLKLSLLLRSNRGLTLTEQGRQFYEHAKRIVTEIEAGEQAAREASIGLSGRLRVTTTMTFASRTILPALPRFLEKHPHLGIDLLMNDQQIDLLKEGIDVALRFGTLNDSTMIARKLAERPRVVVATPAYFAKAGIPQHPTDLQSHQNIMYALKRGGIFRTFRRDAEETTIELTGRFHTNSIDGIRAAVLADMGVAVAAQWIFWRELAAGTVQAVLSDWSLPSAELWAVYPAGRMASTKARAFVTFVEELLAEMQREEREAERRRQG
jgi:DNA-binding transcriptional LysR family regulator